MRKHAAQVIRQVLAIGGSDSGGGAGIQADIKAIHANGAYALSVLTSITAQNTKEISASLDLPLRLIEAQISAIFDDFHVSAVKTGMLSSKGIVRKISLLLTRFNVGNLVVDPVMFSKSGYPLLQPDAVSLLKSHLIPLATLVTPNTPEAESLAEIKIKGIVEAEKAARKIHAFGSRAVLIKGGHLPDHRGCDLLFDGQKTIFFKGQFIDTSPPHGTGCSHAAAIAARLAQGDPLKEAVRHAKLYITGAIRHAHPIGHGHHPTNHLYSLPQRTVLSTD